MNKCVSIMLALLMVANCAPKKQSVWDDIDYSKVHNRQARENDSGYVAPAGAYNCVDDDLYNCNR